MSHLKQGLKFSLIFYLLVFIFLTACQVPRQTTQTTPNQGKQFRIQNAFDAQIKQLPYAPDPYAQFTVVAKSGHSPIQVITERTVPKNLQLSFEDNVNILPTQLHRYLVRGLNKPESALMADLFIQDFERIFAQYSSMFWAEFIKLQQKELQAFETAQESKLKSLEQGSSAYLEAEKAYQEARIVKVELFSKQRKILREAFEQAKLAQLETVRKRFKQGDFSVQGKCIADGLAWLVCSISVSISDIYATTLKTVVSPIAMGFGVSQRDIDYL